MDRRAPKKIRKIVSTSLILIVILSICYFVAVFSNIPFIAKWRTVYIETAMSTMTHKWLATKFIPESVINSVMDAANNTLESQKNLQSTWSSESPASSGNLYGADKSGEDEFLNTFNEIDEDSFDRYTAGHPGVLNDGYDKLLIDESDLDSKGTSIVTKEGDEVLAIDAVNGILIIKVTGDGYVGKLAIIKDPSKVSLAVSNALGSTGESVADIAKANDAVLAINASGFSDPNGTGNGGEVDGLIISNGKIVVSSVNNNYMMIGFTDDNKLYIGYGLDESIFRDAVQFYPAEVINGKSVINNSAGFGIQPRTVIGQASDNSVLMLTVDGRQIGYSVGCTVGDCADIMLRYGAVQACSLDGGSSTIMVYKGKVITKPSNGCDYGRYVPDAFIVKYSDESYSGRAVETR